jgi:chromosomal replication initiation ATPase DnaA
MSRVDHWSDKTGYAAEMRRQTMNFAAAMRGDVAVTADIPHEKVAQLEEELSAVKAENERLRDLVGAPDPLGFKPQKLAQSVAACYGMKLSDLRRQSRNRTAVIARHHAVWLVGETFKYLSLTMLGRIFRRDHTTILYARRKHPTRVALGITMPDPNLDWLA